MNADIAMFGGACITMVIVAVISVLVFTLSRMSSKGDDQRALYFEEIDRDDYV